MRHNTLLLHLAVSATLGCACGIGNPALAAVPGDEFWSPDFHHAGVAGVVNAMWSRPGVLYVGGTFNEIGAVPVARVAALTTTTSPSFAVTGVGPMGAGLDGTVRAFCEYEGDLVATGSFVNSGAEVVQHVARWDGAAWRPFGDGLPGAYPRAAVVYGGDLYVDHFRWNGMSWEDVFQPYGGISSLVVHDGLLYVAGSFTEIRGEPVPHVFAWDGSQVLALGEGFPFDVFTMTSAADGLYAAGDGQVGAAWYSQVARWDGAAWTTESTYYVTDLATYGGDVYASTIILMPGHNHQYVLMSNAGGTWQTVAQVQPEAMAAHDGLLLVQADVGDAPGLFTPGLAAFDGASLQDVFVPPAGFSTGYRTLEPWGPGLLVGGDFHIADGQLITGSALTFSGNWIQWGSPTDIPTGFPASLDDIVTVGMNAFGLFTWVDWDVQVPVPARLVSGPTGYSWQAIDPGAWNWGRLQPVGSALFNIYGGYLELIDPQTAVATQLAPFAADGNVYGTCEYLGALTICGNFSTINGEAVGNVARYTGVWSGVGDPLPVSQVQAVAAMDDGTLAAATYVDGVYRVWSFDGSAWALLPGDFDAGIVRLIEHRGRLFAAGGFSRIGLMPASGLAVWTGEVWAPVGSGLTGGYSWNRVSDIASYGDDLYVCGNFTRSGGHPSAGIAAFSGDPTLFTGPPSTVPVTGPAAEVLLAAARPNPFNPRTEVAFVVPAAGRVRIGIHDLRGRLVRELLDEELGAGRHVRAWDGRDDAGRELASGVYLVRMRAGDAVGTLKLTLVR